MPKPKSPTYLFLRANIVAVPNVQHLAIGVHRKHAGWLCRVYHVLLPHDALVSKRSRKTFNCPRLPATPPVVVDTTALMDKLSGKLETATTPTPHRSTKSQTKDTTLPLKIDTPAASISRAKSQREWAWLGKSLRSPSNEKSTVFELIFLIVRPRQVIKVRPEVITCCYARRHPIASLANKTKYAPEALKVLQNTVYTAPVLYDS